jgi:hypothetical protein
MRQKRVTFKNSSPIELAESFTKIKGLTASNKQIDQLADLYKHFKDHGETVMKRQAAFKNVVKMIELKVDTLFVRRLIRSSRMGGGITLKKMLTLYSKNGYDIWEKYVKVQSETNTFKYKNKKYGMTPEEFDQYNKSRAQTKENMIKRYGEEDGLAKWEAYVDRQSYAGVTLEYFIEKYGKTKGKEQYEKINQLKSNSVDSIMHRLGCTKNEAIDIRLTMNTTPFASRISQEFCWDLYNKLDDKHKTNCYFSELNKEFSKWSNISNKIYFYDFVITGNVNLVIEFHGDYYHANPDMYEPEFKGFFFNKNLTAEDIWNLDKQKKESAEQQGFRYIAVWESNFKNNPDKEIQRCLDEINRT